MAVKFGSDTSLAFSVIKAGMDVTIVPELDAGLVDLRLIAKNDKVEKSDNTRMKVRVPIPDGARVCGFSFGGVPAVAVQKKEAARIVYLEAEKGNAVARADNLEAPAQATHADVQKLFAVFETEVHPFPFGEEREIAVSFYCPSLRRSTDGQWRLALPVQLGGLSPALRARAVPDGPVEVQWSEAGDELLLQGQLPASPPRLFLADAYGATHFCASVPAAEGTREASRAALAGKSDAHPGALQEALSVALLWDSSRSRGDTDHEAALSLISQLGDAAAAAGKRLEATVVAFDVRPRVLARRASAAEAVKTLRGLQGRYDGGTDLSCLREALAGEHDLCVLFSDGGDNLGAARALSQLDLSKCRLHAVWEGAGKPPDALAALARASGGVCAQVGSEGLARTLAGVDEPRRAERVELDGLELEDLVDGSLETIPDCRLARQAWPLQGDLLRVSGSLGAKTPSSVKATIADSAGSRCVELPIGSAVRVDAGTREASLVALLHCEQRLLFDNVVAPDPRLCARTAVEAARKYGVATTHTTLLMLEHAEQFVQHAVDCPEGHPAFAEWRKLQARRAEEEAAAKKQAADSQPQRLELKQLSRSLAEKLASYMKNPLQFAPPPRAEPSRILREHGYVSRQAAMAPARNGRAMGIDLGTTNSCVGVWRDESVQIVANEHDSRTTPSCVAYAGDSQVVGEEALRLGRSSPECAAVEAKRLIGRRFSDPSVQEDMGRWPFRVTAGDDNRPVVELGAEGTNHRLLPEEVSAAVLSKMKKVAEDFEGQSMTDVVITVPAHFSDSQRQATKDAGSLAGLSVLRIINEPTAAAIAYGLDKGTTEERNVLIFDLGGGTLDVTLLTIEEGIFEVKTVAGDSHLGGADFDERLVRHCLGELKRQHGADLAGDARAMACLRHKCELARRELSSKSSADVLVEWKGGTELCSVSRTRFEELCQDLFDRCAGAVDRCVRDAGMQRAHVHDVVLVGGCSHMPRVQQMLRELFDGKEPYASIDPEEAVAYGATVQSAILSGAGNSAFQDLLLLDVTPLSLGVASANGSALLADGEGDDEDTFAVLIPRNTTIPTRRTVTFTTHEHNQPSVVLPIYEGESGSLRDNNLLGTFRVDGLSPMAAGAPQIEVTFDIDANGVLNVSARDMATGRSNQIAVSNDRGRLSQMEIDSMIRAHGEQQEEQAWAAAAPAEAFGDSAEIADDAAEVAEQGAFEDFAGNPDREREDEAPALRRKKRRRDSNAGSLRRCAAEPCTMTAEESAMEGENQQAQPEDGQTRIEKYSGDERDFLEPIMQADEPYEEFLRQSRGRHGRSPAFYLLAAQALHARDRPVEEVLRAATNALELGAEDAQLLRSVAYLALHLSRFEFAVSLFERVADLAPEEPQSLLDLALSLFFQLRHEQPQRQEVCKEALARAMECAARVVVGKWAHRFDEVEWPALLALNWMASFGEHVGFTVEELWPDQLLPVEGARVPLQSRLLVWLSWDTDKTDIDLHVVEPSGEEVYYSHKFSQTGGIVSKDFTQGYGPEVYLNRDAPAGKYQVRSKYYSSHQVSAATGATCAVLWRVSELGDFDREELSVSVVRLNRNKQMQDVMMVEIPEKDTDSKAPRASLVADDDAASRAASVASVHNILEAAASKDNK